MVAILLETNGADPQDLQQRWTHLQFNLFSILNCSAVLVFGTTLYVMMRKQPVYFVVYACNRPAAN
ncbi:hypothetical protein HPP92_023084 [Vanilla planifolia]|uniref:Uncharacterized protein n=1 Tax=Vanilla planifolia TaxID=51239 RepID=A0A835UHV0_VANPL|nr:hypothetical protein HPP92_023084 [Vanilla planifolia]